MLYHYAEIVNPGCRPNCVKASSVVLDSYVNGYGHCTQALSLHTTHSLIFCLLTYLRVVCNK